MELHQLAFRAMNCDMAAWVTATDPTAAEERLVAARDFVQAAEAQLSRFLPESDLSRLNAQPGQRVHVSRLLWDVVVWALDAARRTDGLYDPTILDALEAAGYDRSFEQLQDDGRLAEPAAPRTVTWRDIKLEPNTRSVTLPAGMRLDLGGVAKGWTADRAADLLADLGPCMVDAGGDITARGAPPDQAGWPIGVADPQDPESDLALLIIRDRGVATSGVDYRRWTRGGVTQHHIIDPRTGRSAQTDLLTVTVIAPDAAQADLHALVTMLLGVHEGRRYLASQPGVEALLVADDGRQFFAPGFEQYVFGR